MNEVYQDIHQQEEKQDRKDQKRKLFGKVIHYIRVLWIFLFDYTIPIILKNEVHTKKLIISLLLSPGIIFLATGVPDCFNETIIGIPEAIWYSIPSVLLLAYMVFNLVRGSQPYFTTIFNIYGFVIVVVWITLVVAVLINLMELLQLLTNINPVFLGLTVFAGAGSIGDYLSIVTFAKRGYSSTAVSGVFAGQLLNFLFGFGVALTIKSLSKGEYNFQIFSIQGDTYDKWSDFIVIVVISMSFIYMVGMIVVVLLKK
jgi:Ca2+/Na+ antiporter